MTRQGSGTSIRASSSRPADPEEVRDRDGMTEGDERGVDAVLQGRPVADEVETEASTLPFGPHRWVGQPDLGHEVTSRRARRGPRRRSCRSWPPAVPVPLTLTASPMATSQPASSSWSWTKRAPVIDSITAGHLLAVPEDMGRERPERIGVRADGGHLHRLTILVEHVHIEPLAR